MGGMESMRTWGQLELTYSRNAFSITRGGINENFSPQKQVYMSVQSTLLPEVGHSPGIIPTT
jgi:hypothetical protein